MTLKEKPFSQASVNNREPILSVLDTRLMRCRNLLEIGSGTGQHACYFTSQLPHLYWQTSDRLSCHPGINLWLDELECTNFGRPLELDVNCSQNWDEIVRKHTCFDAVFTANTAHIMPWQTVRAMFKGTSRVLCPGGLFFIYGPFNRNGEFTSTSNHNFNAQLQSQNPEMGIRDDRAVFKLADHCALEVIADFEMPANNRMLLFKNAQK